MLADEEILRGKNNADFSVLAYCNRREIARKKGCSRFYKDDPGMLGFPSGSTEFKQDLMKIQKMVEWRRLQAVSQFTIPCHAGYSYLYCNRFTHTMDVQYVAETIANYLLLDEDSINLSSAIASVHDLGHMPFNHWGEQAAIEKLKPYKRTFTHDAAGLRVVTEWAIDGVTYPGLNLTMDVLEGLTKRYWRYLHGQKQDYFNHSRKEIPECIIRIDKEKGLHLDKYNHVEGQIAAIADWIAFTITDIEDGLRSGWMTLKEVNDNFPLAKRTFDKFVENIRCYYREKYVTRLKQDPESRQSALLKAFKTHMREALMQDVAKQTNSNVLSAFCKTNNRSPHYQYAEEVRDMDKLIVSFSPEVLQEMKTFQNFCAHNVHARMIMQVGSVQKLVEMAIDDFVSGVLEPPYDWRQRRKSLLKKAKSTFDANAGLTELACEFLQREFTEAQIVNYVKKKHPIFWQENFVTESDQKAPGEVARHNALSRPLFTIGDIRGQIF